LTPPLPDCALIPEPLGCAFVAPLPPDAGVPDAPFAIEIAPAAPEPLGLAVEALACAAPPLPELPLVADGADVEPQPASTNKYKGQKPPPVRTACSAMHTHPETSARTPRELLRDVEFSTGTGSTNLS
jgi:hypothetical protein